MRQLKCPIMRDETIQMFVYLSGGVERLILPINVVFWSQQSPLILLFPFYMIYSYLYIS